MWVCKIRYYGTTFRISDTEQCNVRGTDIYDIGFTVRAKTEAVVFFFKNEYYGTQGIVSDIEQRNVWGSEIYGIGFTVRVKSGGCGFATIDAMGQRLMF